MREASHVCIGLKAFSGAIPSRREVPRNYLNLYQLAEAVRSSE